MNATVFRASARLNVLFLMIVYAIAYGMTFMIYSVSDQTLEQAATISFSGSAVGGGFLLGMLMIVVLFYGFLGAIMSGKLFRFVLTVTFAVGSTWLFTLTVTFLFSLLPAWIVIPFVVSVLIVLITQPKRYLTLKGGAEAQLAEVVRRARERIQQ